MKKIDIKKIKVLSLNNDRIELDVNLNTTVSHLKYILDRLGFMSRYECVVYVNGREPQDSEIIDVPVVLASRRTFLGMYAMCIDDTFVLNSKYNNALEIKRGEVLKLNHSNQNSYTALATKSNNKTGTVYMSCLKPIICTDTFLKSITPKKSTFTELSLDSIRIIFLFLSHNDFLSFRASCSAVFVASRNRTVRSRILYLAQKKWKSYHAPR
jgi:hypothetical protein